MVAPAVPVAFTMGNALTGIGTGLALAQGTHIAQRIYGYLTSDGNGGVAFIPEMGGPPGSVGSGISGLQVMDPTISPPKKRRKRSEEHMEFGRSMKALKRKHPRTPSHKLMKKAHTLTKRTMKKRRK